MSSEFDATEFVDSDFKAAQKTPYAPSHLSGPGRAPTREEVDSKMGDAQQKLAELKRLQEDLERERASLEETRRRQLEFQTGRQEMITNLTRGVTLLQEAEFSARRDAEQMTNALGDLQDALGKIMATNEESWTKDNFGVELTRALTTIENGRMEWNTARLKFPILSGEQALQPKAETASKPAESILQTAGFFQLCKIGFALTWPLVIVALGALGVLIAIVSR